MDIREYKRKIRKDIIKTRDCINENKKEKLDKILKETLFESEYYRHAKKIFMYVSYGSEIETHDIITESINQGKEIYIPRTKFETKLMNAVRFQSFNQLVKDRYGILEPSEEEPFIDPNELDLIIVPGVAFDKNGGRLGYGAGYYDRYFGRISDNVLKVALAYDFQLISDVPRDENDVLIDCIITEKNIIII